DVAHAGFWGGYIPKFDDLTQPDDSLSPLPGAPDDYPSAVPDPCLAYASWDAQYKKNLVGIPVQGYEIPATVPSPTLSVCASRVVSPKASTDVLVVRHADMRDFKCVPGASGCDAVDGDVHFQMDRTCGAVPPTTPYVLDADKTQLTLLQRATASSNCATTEMAAYRKLVSSLYYVRNYAVTAGDGVPTLMRSQLGSGGGVEHKPAEPLIEGVEGFRVEFGVDSLSDSGAAVNQAAVQHWANSTNKTSPTNRGDGIPDGSYVRCTTATPCTVAQLANAVAVKIYVLIRADNITPGYTDNKTYNLGSTTLGPFNDNYKRHLFQQTVRLQNVSSRRETP
ncbi:MAG: PilW family protein, partial [Ramlibacter sp.]|nr:PilW family protein [Ramlibacter sp.]